MPDTYLAMPRTLSAPYAGLLEAEAPRTTTSDALPNGTAAAAAAFAGLLAPGDQAMHPKASTSTERNPDAFRASLLATTTIPALGMTFREAADQTRALLDAYPAVPENDEARRDAQGSEWQRLHDAVLTAPAQTFGDLLAKVERMACPHIGMRTFHLKDAERGMLERDVERLHSQFGAGTDADAEIFAAFKRWTRLMQDCYAAKSDDDCERLSEQADQAALSVMTHEPTSPEGLATQVFVMLHLEHGGTTADRFDIDYSTTCDPDDGAHALAVHALVERIRRIGRPGRGGASQELPTSLYARWVEIRTRYLTDGDKTEEELEALEDELDQLEDRLESEPVRCIADAVAKLGYFLTVSNAMLKNGQMPNLNPRLSSPLDRVLAAVEDGAAILPETMREPFQALVTGLRQLMQLHVKLAGESERKAGAYQLPDEVSQAMQAVYARNVAESTAAEARGSDHVKKEANEIAGTFRRLDTANRRVLLSLTHFMSVSAHLHDAMLGFARQHGMTRHYRGWLEGHLSDIPAERDGANDQHHDADAFADTVAAFEAEAPATLALPLEPTGRMVDAGASAAGITPAQFQAAYAAAVEALKLERAA